MKEINEEIKLTLDSMQKTDIDEGSHSELRYHVSTLVEALELIIKAAPGRGSIMVRVGADCRSTRSPRCLPQRM